MIQDLLDTLEANRDRCVGMAANMIGVKKNIIVINIGMINMAMVNARIIDVYKRQFWVSVRTA